MSRFSIDTEAMLSNKGALDGVSGNLRRYSGRVAHASSTIAEVMSSGAGANVSSTLSARAEQLLTEAARMESLAGAVEYIARAYESSDERAMALMQSVTQPSTSQKGGTTDTGGDTDGGGIGGLVKRIQEAIIKVIEWILHGPESGMTPEEMAREQERAHDLAMQDEVFSRLQSSQFSEETWRKATIEERKQMLRDLVPVLAAIYGIPAPSNIVFEDMGNDGSRGSYNRSHDRIKINDQYIARADGYDIMYTMVHEMRHAYQHEVVDHPENFQVSAETVAQWRDNFETGHYRSYGDPAPDGHLYTYEEYVQQPVEWDAKNFAKQIEDRSKYRPDYEGSWPVN